MSDSNSDSSIRKILAAAPPMPMSPRLWQTVVRAARLSPRQARVTELVMRGLGDRQIAVVMGLSEPTVRTYLTRLFKRFHASSRMELAMRIMETALEILLDPTAAHGA